MNPKDTVNLLLDMMMAGASKEELHQVIDDYKEIDISLSNIEKMAEKYTYRSPLDTMTIEERCRWFYKELMAFCGGAEGSTEFEEALIFKDAADEIFTSNRIIETQLYLINELKKRIPSGPNEEEKEW